MSIIHFSEARDKFSIDPWLEVYLVLEEDGTEVDDEEYFQVEAIYDHHQQLKLGMSEKLCLQWNDYKDDVESTFGVLREDKEFTDVTLACEDGQQMEAHKVILSSLSSFFKKILKKNKHPHPLIYLKGFQSKDFLSILDFLYSGETNVYQEDLNSFLAIAEEIQLKGLTGQTISDLVEEQKQIEQKSTTQQSDIKPLKNSTTYTTVALPNQSRTDLQALDEKVKLLIEKGQNMIPVGQRNGRPREETSRICKVCGKEGRITLIKQHIEANHLEGICIPCDFCENTFSSRNALNQHRSKLHR